MFALARAALAGPSSNRASSRERAKDALRASIAYGSSPDVIERRVRARTRWVRRGRELELERRLAVERDVARDAHHGAAAVEWTTRTARRGEFSGDRERGGEVQERLIRPAE